MDEQISPPPIGNSLADILSPLPNSSNIERAAASRKPVRLNLGPARSADREVAEAGPVEPMMLSMLNASPDCIKLVELNGTISYMNYNGQCAMDVASFELIRGKPWTGLWPEHARALVQNAVESAREGHATRFEAYCPTAKGRAKWWDVSVAPVLSDGGKVERILSISRDISDMVERERRLREHDNQLVDFSEAQAEALAAKEKLLQVQDTLMREIDHRVKNSLAMISSLLRMQANGSSNTEVRDELNDASNRVLTVSRVHERLYRGRDVTTVTVSDYLEPLCTEIRDAVADKSIDLRFDLDDARVPADTAIGLGLVVSELLSNALRHAFEEQANCAIEIAFKGDSEAFELSIADDGCGLPDDFDLTVGSGLGMKIVQLYTMQLGGRLQHDPNGDCGTRFAITVPAAPRD